ncbi:MAG: WD40 repeat domain-containing protein, partial [Desulfobaccales bacterium]
TFARHKGTEVFLKQEYSLITLVFHQPARAMRSHFLEEIGFCYNSTDLPVTFLFALRKEFVEDLQNFSPAIAQPLDIRFRSTLRNWDRDTALSVLNAMAVHDQVALADVLKDQLIEELLRDGQVRPVELQLVATRLQDEGIYDLRKYRAADRARGVLAAYVREAVAPLGAATQELQRQVARHMLHALCADKRDARRPKGLSLVEIREQVRGAMQVSGQGELLTTDQELDAALHDALKRCIDLYLIILESEDRYNLAHDYIVPSIRDATADLRSIEEQANQLLSQYLDQQSVDRWVAMPLRHYRFIRKNASPELKGGEKAICLFSWSRRCLCFKFAVAIIVPLVILSLLLPPHTETVLHTADVKYTNWLFSRDKLLAVAWTPNKTAVMWHTDKPWRSREEVPISFVDLIISPRSGFIAGKTPEGNVYVWRSSSRLTREARPAITGLVVGDEWRSTWVGFSEDERLVFVASGDGKIFLWNPADILEKTPKPFLSLQSEKQRDSWVGSKVSFSPDGLWLAAITSKNLYLCPLIDGPPEQPIPLLSDINLSCGIIFSRDGRWAAAATSTKLYAWSMKIQHQQQLNPILIHGEDEKGGFGRIAFSPDGKWLIFRPVRQNFYAVQVADIPGGQARAIASDPYNIRWGMTLRGLISFSKDGKWAGGIDSSGHTYFWSLVELPIHPISPIIANTAGLTYGIDYYIKFSPKGDYAVAKGPNADVYLWEANGQLDLLQPKEYSKNSNIRFSADNRYLFCFADGRLSWAELGKELQTILKAKDYIDHIAMRPQGEELIVLGKSYMTTVRRKLFFWGIPLWTRPWPLLEEEAEGTISGD